MSFIDFLCHQMQTHTHAHTWIPQPLTQQVKSSEGTSLFLRILVCVHVCKSLSKRFWTMKSVSRGMWISVSLAVVSPLPVQVFLHIWTTLAPPSTSWQGIGERMDGGRKRGCVDAATGEGLKWELAEARVPPLVDFPFVQEECSQCHCASLMYTGKQMCAHRCKDKVLEFICKQLKLPKQTPSWLNTLSHGCSSQLRGGGDVDIDLTNLCCCRRKVLNIRWAGGFEECLWYIWCVFIIYVVFSSGFLWNMMFLCQ